MPVKPKPTYTEADKEYIYDILEHGGQSTLLADELSISETEVNQIYLKMRLKHNREMMKRRQAVQPAKNDINEEKLDIKREAGRYSNRSPYGIASPGC